MFLKIKNMFEIDEGKAEMDYCFTRMMNLNSEESNMCKFNSCTYYDFENDKCSRNICIKVEKNES